MSHKQDFENVYSAPGRAIWTLPTPPAILTELIETGTVKPCDALDVGCGEGTSAIFLAQKGFAVTGVDFIEKAIGYAKEHAAREKTDVDFRIMPASEIDNIIGADGKAKRFGLVFEWGLLHHMEKAEMHLHVAKVASILNEGGLYVTNSFNSSSSLYGSPGDRIRKTPIGTELHYREQQEMAEMFSRYFKIIDEDMVNLHGQHDVVQPGNYFLLRKK